MRRFFINNGDNLNPRDPIELTGDEFHHLRNVCRLEEGERVELLDGRGRIALATILKIGKKAASLNVESVQSLPAQPLPQTEIVLCLPRFQKMDLIIQKSVELGAARIVPVVSDRSFVKDISKDLAGKVQRWNKIALEACKQSGRVWPLEIAPVTELQTKISQVKDGLFLYEGEAAQDIRSVLSAYATAPAQLSVFVGPEGGFSPREVEVFKEKGLPPTTMGPLVLRVETACIALLSVIDYQFGAMR